MRRERSREAWRLTFWDELEQSGTNWTETAAELVRWHLANDRGEGLGRGHKLLRYIYI